MSFAGGSTISSSNGSDHRIGNANKNTPFVTKDNNNVITPAAIITTTTVIQSEEELQQQLLQQQLSEEEILGLELLVDEALAMILSFGRIRIRIYIIYSSSSSSSSR